MDLGHMPSGHHREKANSSISLYVLALWVVTHLFSKFFLVSEFLLGKIIEIKNFKFGTYVLILAKCFLKLFPAWPFFNIYVLMTSDYTKDRKIILRKEVFQRLYSKKERKKEGKKAGGKKEGGRKRGKEEKERKA